MRITTCFLFLLTFLLTLPAAPQNVASATAAASAQAAVPPLIPYSGTVGTAPSAQPVTSASITFLIYKDEQGGEPLFTETQSVAVDVTGAYKAQLGATLANGIPTDLFATGEARWLEVQVAGETPQPRVLLVSVPYAFKAADATTLGGLPVSAFALAGQNIRPAVAAGGITPDGVSNVTTTGGSAGYIPEFSGASTIVDSPIFVSGSNVGIGLTTPTVPFEVTGNTVLNGTMTVNGSSTYNGGFTLPPPGTATSSKSYNSQFLKIETSAWNSSSASAVSPRFEWVGEVAGNNTATPTATLNLQSSTTTAPPTETGFHFNANGTINFAPGQTFPANSTAFPASSNGSAFFGGAGNSTSTGINNMAMGSDSLGKNTTGIQNVALGDVALYSNTTGSSNTASGANALGDIPPAFKIQAPELKRSPSTSPGTTTRRSGLRQALIPLRQTSTIPPRLACFRP